MKGAFVLVVFLWSFGVSHAQKQTAAEAFNDKVKRIDSIFLQPVTALASQKYSRSPTARIFYQLKFEKLNMEMSVHGDTAFITLKLHVTTNAKSGDVEGYKEQVGYTDSAKAKAGTEFQSCESKGFWTDEWCRGDIRVIYEWRQMKWQLKGIKTEIANKIQLGTIRSDIEHGVLDPWLR